MIAGSHHVDAKIKELVRQRPGVMPNPAAEFSPLAITRSTEVLLYQPRQPVF